MCEIIHENASMRMFQIYSYFKVGPRFAYFVSFVLFFLGGRIHRYIESLDFFYLTYF